MLAGILWGLLPLFTKQLYAAGVSGMQVGVMRALSGGLIYSIYGISKGIFKQYSVRDIPILILYGVVSLGGMYLAYALAIEMLSSSAAVALLYTAPVFVTVFCRILYHETISAGKMVSLLLTMSGCAFAVGLFEKGAFQGSPVGILLGLAAGLCYSMVTVMGKSVLNKYSSLQATILPSVGAAFVLAAICPDWNIPVNGKCIMLYLAIGLIGSVLPFLLYVSGMGKGVDGSTASVVVMIEPLTATVIGVTCFGEYLSVLQTMGMLLIISGAAIPVINYSISKKGKKHERREKD